MERSIILGGNEYKYKINFRLSYDFLKFRNRITSGLDFSKLDKKVIQEISDMQEKVQKQQEQGITDINELEFLDELSPEAIAFLSENSKTDVNIFNENEILEIVSKFTGKTDTAELLDILDKEVELEGFDNMISKFVNAISEVFMNAKDISAQKAESKMELEKTINK